MIILFMAADSQNISFYRKRSWAESIDELNPERTPYQRQLEACLVKL
jgi:hypothetical protein